MADKEATTKENVKRILTILTGNGAVGMIERLGKLEDEHQARLSCQVTHEDLEILRTGQAEIGVKLDDHISWHATTRAAKLKQWIGIWLAAAATAWAIYERFL